jgi:flagellar secretion chaperone FliS
MNMSKGAQQYAKLNKSTAVEEATPHQLIQMLYQGALDNLQQSIGHMERKDYEAKGNTIGRAISIIGGLQGFLDHEKGGDIARNLDSLYDYMMIRLYEATRENSLQKVQEVIGLLKQIKTGWDSIAEEANKLHTQQVKES